jgi:DsbE subfamily thiol:disulfide oxidoreductase
MIAARKLRYGAPLAVFAVLLGFLGYRLFLVEQGFTPDLIPPALINKPAPQFDLPSLYAKDPAFRSEDLRGKVTLVNFFASWCVPCKVEHPYLSQVTKDARVELIGVVYKDRPEDASVWLVEQGDPYRAVAVDAEGKTGIDFGVYGLPESYLIDKQGVIRFKQTGPLTPEVIQTRLVPLAKSLNR